MARIHNDELSVEIATHYGARVTSLLDRRTGREWMAQGGESDNTGESAVYAADECIGWDECFPTVSVCDATATPWRRRLRDHGDLWGREAEVMEHEGHRLITRQASSLCAFTRTLELEGTTLRALYRLDNLSDVDVPYLWALHGLLQVGPRDRIVLPGIDKVLATYLGRDGRALNIPELNWPDAGEAWPDRFDLVQPVTVQTAAKLYVPDWSGGKAYVGQNDDYLSIGWSDGIDSLGIWLNYGAWPEPGQMHQIALEPTNAPVDDLAHAIERGTPPLPAGGSHQWSVEFTVRTTPPAV